MATKLLPGVLFFLRGSIASLPRVERTLPKHRGDAMGPEYLWSKIEGNELSIHGYWPTWDDYYGDAVVALVKALAKTGVEGTAGVWHDGTRETDHYHVEYRLRGGALKVKTHDPDNMNDEVMAKFESHWENDPPARILKEAKAREKSLRQGRS